MKHNAPPDPDLSFETLRMPGWVAGAEPETLEDAAFLSGAALGALHLVIGQRHIPQALLRDRLALSAAETCVAFAGRPERAAALRDAVHLLRPGEHPGPAGAVFALWRAAVCTPLERRGMDRLRALLPETLAQAAPATLPTGAVAAAAAMLEAAQGADPRAEAAALILADATLARLLGWQYPLPLMATALTRRELRLSGTALHMACHRAVTTSAVEAHRMALDLGRRAAHLRKITPKLRAKGAKAAVALFLSEDALSPSLALSPVIRGSAAPMTDRAARRLCERLVALGAVRELTGRPGFRLYGL